MNNDMMALSVWASIETAPKDGTVFLATDGKYVSLCVWENPAPNWPDGRFMFDQWRNACCSSNLSSIAHDAKPVYWTDLLRPPSISQPEAVN